MPGKKISLSKVEHYFDSHQTPGAKIQVLQPTDLNIEARQFVALVGPSGCGKTTILNMVAGLVAPTHGTLVVDDRKPQVGDRNVGYLLARDALLPWRTALENVVLPLEIAGVDRAERESRGRRLLQEAGLGSFIDAYPAHLSHGMRQRVAVLRTLSTEPDTLLMDEPFSALDAQTRLTLQQLFLRLWERINSTVLFVTHDLTEAILMADRVLIFSGRPGTIKADFHIDLERPRSLIELQGSDRFHELFRNIWDVLRSEVASEH